MFTGISHFLEKLQAALNLSMDELAPVFSDQTPDSIYCEQPSPWKNMVPFFFKHTHCLAQYWCSNVNFKSKKNFYGVIETNAKSKNFNFRSIWRPVWEKIWSKEGKICQEWIPKAEKHSKKQKDFWSVGLLMVLLWKLTFIELWWMVFSF